ncbi:hypothetical protein FD754_021911 [Muntiacus muntjak]|uniref:Uncharacterized protein n=1 Tax=Muntiacus muntjak TaxID=9888 RepID=A0A5N3V7E9_MUNMU|nr:hypothetical protein FD754_021911 [Muntiacus muntjak]
MVDLHTTIYNAVRGRCFRGCLVAGQGGAGQADGRVGTPLIITSHYSHLDVLPWATSATDALDLVQSLLYCGALVSCTMHTCTKYLRADCFSGHVEVVHYSAGEHRVDLEVTNRCGHTCLMISCYTGPCQIARYLILQGAQVNLCSIKDNVALHDCTKAGSPGVLQLLFGCQACREWDGYSMTPPLAAHVMDHISIVEDLSQEQPAGEETWRGMAREGPSTSQACVPPQRACCCSSSQGEHLSTSWEAKQDLLRVLKLLVGAVELRHQGACICLNLKQSWPLPPDTSHYMRYQDVCPRTTWPRGSLSTPVGFADLMWVLCKGLGIQFTKALAITLHLLYLLEKVECKPNQEDMKHQSYCLSVPVTARMSSLLHMAVVKVPLTVGPTQTATILTTPPMHIAKENNCLGIMNALIEVGAHMDTTNAFKKTAYELLHEKLLCISACTLDKNNIPCKGFIP